MMQFFKRLCFAILLLGTSVIGFAQEAIMVDPNGNVGINTNTPQAQLDINGNVIIDGHLFKRVHMATGLGPGDDTNNGQIVSRVLTFTKLFDDTAIKISYTDNLRPHSPGSNYGSSRWEIKIDGQSIPGGHLVYDAYIGSSATSNAIHIPVTVIGFAEGLTAGVYEIQIWVQSPVPGHPYAGDPHTGWLDSRWTIEAEEVWIQQ